MKIWKNPLDLASSMKSLKNKYSTLPSQRGDIMKIIDLEAHFVTRELADYINANTRMPIPSNHRLLDMEEGRLKDMDRAGIDMQVISIFQSPDIPHVQNLEVSEAKKWARQTNDRLSLAVKKYPDRFIGLAAIPVQRLEDAVEELKRAIMELGLKGVCLVSNAIGEYFDDKKYWEIFRTAEALDVPIYLHPTRPSTTITDGYTGYPDLMGAPHGFHTDVSLHVMRLIYSGLFDRYPGLKMILGHMGEGLPFWFPRIDFAWGKSIVSTPDIEKKPSEYIKRNFTVTTSGMFFQPALICAYLAMGADNIAFAVDYPPEDNETAVQFIKAAPISDRDKEKICHTNAEALFHI